MSMNVRKFPRTLNEAFPGGVEYSCAIEVPYRSRRKAWLRVFGWACLFGIITLLINTYVDQLS